ncbi:MAG: hypothetical protein IKR48_09860 [Kiritimatiellae bacterium]|nr:hypothetical protein [Kiritimatiellia bacterium]
MIRCLNVIPIIEACVIVWLSLHRHHSFIPLISCFAVFILSSFPILRMLKAHAKFKTEFKGGEEITYQVKELFKEFVKTWWGFIIGTLIMTTVRGILTSKKISFAEVGSFLMTTAVLFALFETMVTGWALCNIGAFRRGQFGYKVQLIIEYFMYNILTVTFVVCGS